VCRRLRLSGDSGLDEVNLGRALEEPERAVVLGGSDLGVEPDPVADLDTA